MIPFIKGVIHDLLNRSEKLLSKLESPGLFPEVDADFLFNTTRLLRGLQFEINELIGSGNLEVDELLPNLMAKYNTFYERLMSIELFRYLVIIHYGEPEVYFKRLIHRIYSEIGSMQKEPVVSTISNPDSYYWAFPAHDIIAVPNGEEKSLLTLPDIYHEIAHLIYSQSQEYLVKDINQKVETYYNDELQRVINEDRPDELKAYLTERKAFWKGAWVMEFACDLIATYLVGPAYGWANLKLCTISSAQQKIYEDDSGNHPSDESRMRAIFKMLELTGQIDEKTELVEKWNNFLGAANNPIAPDYAYAFPDELIDQLAEYVLRGCQIIALKGYPEQVSTIGAPVAKVLNQAWQEVMLRPLDFEQWEIEQIALLKAD